MTAGAKEKSALRLEGRTSAERGAEKAAGGGHLHAPATRRLPSQVKGPGGGVAFGAGLAASSVCLASLLDTPSRPPRVTSLAHSRARRGPTPSLHSGPQPTANTPRESRLPSQPPPRGPRLPAT